ncbi:hypothetical protein [Halomicrococcus sp. NG-SE-24]|uniref:hypothetical protein n=1 Tax=Halomicrococcus sp. NG-SE-24 TaxID=3436928 RepID=UPI003D972C30
MTLKDWINESIDRYQTQPVWLATRESALQFIYGTSRRTIDPHLGTPIWESDASLVLVLDACRVDLLREVVDDYDWLPESNDIESRWSPGACSIDWIVRTFREHEAEAQKTAYITANPWIDQDVPWKDALPISSERFADLQKVYETDWQDIGGGVETTPPNAVTRDTYRICRDNPENVETVVAHYMQPHQPFKTRPEWTGEDTNLANIVDPDRHAGKCIWERTKRGEFDPDDVWTAYRENLAWVLKWVGRLLAHTDRRVLITADHGNGMGEFGMWGHPPGCRTSVNSTYSMGRNTCGRWANGRTRTADGST